MISTKPKFSLANMLSAALLFLGYLCFFSGRFYVRTFGRLGFDSVLYTLSSDLGGVQSGQITGWLLRGFLPAVLLSAATYFLLWKIFTSHKGKYRRSAPSKLPAFLFSVLLSAGLLTFAAFDVELVEYLLNQSSDTDLYEKYYADPADTAITFPEKKAQSDLHHARIHGNLLSIQGIRRCHGRKPDSGTL